MRLSWILLLALGSQMISYAPPAGAAGPPIVVVVVVPATTPPPPARPPSPGPAPLVSPCGCPCRYMNRRCEPGLDPPECFDHSLAAASWAR